MNKTKKYVAASILIVLFVLFSMIVGCNTVAGFGTDVQNTGHAIHRAAR